MAATATDLLWLDQADLIAVMAEYPATRESLEKTATIQQSVSMSEPAYVSCFSLETNAP